MSPSVRRGGRDFFLAEPVGDVSAQAPGPRKATALTTPVEDLDRRSRTGVRFPAAPPGGLSRLGPSSFPDGDCSESSPAPAQQREGPTIGGALSARGFPRGCLIEALVVGASVLANQGGNWLSPVRFVPPSPASAKSMGQDEPMPFRGDVTAMRPGERQQTLRDTCSEAAR